MRQAGCGLIRPQFAGQPPVTGNVPAVIEIGVVDADATRGAEKPGKTGYPEAEIFDGLLKPKAVFLISMPSRRKEPGGHYDQRGTRLRPRRPRSESRPPSRHGYSIARPSKRLSSAMTVEPVEKSKSIWTDLLTCLACSRQMKVERSDPDPEGGAVVQYRCGSCGHVEQLRLLDRT